MGEADLLVIREVSVIDKMAFGRYRRQMAIREARRADAIRTKRPQENMGQATDRDKG